MMKPPLTYYGGKQQLASRILKLIPGHKLYCEPFFGGGAVFFKKPKSTVEVINDTNGEVVNFYRMVKNEFVSLEKEIRISLHSRDLHRQAKVIYENPDMFSEIKRAWAVWVLANQSFAAIIGDAWGYSLKNDATPKKIRNKRESFTEDYAIRLQDVEIECTDALKIIRTYDSKTSFFYPDPPYAGTDMGHYDGYTWEDFEALLKQLSRIEGKFILSSYPSPMLKEYTKQNAWSTIKIEMNLCASKSKSKPRRKKTEVLTANFSLT
jgi:DNA adenine methylase